MMFPLDSRQIEFLMMGKGKEIRLYKVGYCRNTIVPELGLARALFQGGVALGGYPINFHEIAFVDDIG